MITLESLSENDIKKVLQRAIEDDERGLGKINFKLSNEALQHIVSISDGDVRSALNTLEISTSVLLPKIDGKGKPEPQIITLDILEKTLLKKALIYDKSGEEHYNLISALHKSLRGSDPDASAYWLMRMLEAGEDPMYLARRMVRFASEDIGNADPNALNVALNAKEAFRFLGHPEGDLALLQSAIYLATAPKSNRIYQTYQSIKKTINDTGAQPVPYHIRNAPTKLMKNLGYGKDYKYAHNYKNAIVAQEYLPDKLKGFQFYQPTDRGYEKTIKRVLEFWQKQKSK